MALLEQIRVKLGVAITALIAIALLSFIIDPGTLTTVTQSMSSKYDVGEINGKAISYTDYQKEIDSFTTINELVSGSSVQSEEQQKSIRNTAWQSLVDKYLFVKNAKNAGIVVSDAEVVELTIGDNLSPVIAQDPIFRNEAGEFSKQAVIDFVSNIDADASGNAKLYWEYLQNAIRTQQYYTKYGALFTESNIVNPLMVSKLIENNNNTVNVDFVMVPF
jgi:peptidyl-prolyl cis-trans isomerase D